MSLGAVPLQAMDSAVRELEYVVHDLRVRARSDREDVNGAAIGEARFELFFAAAEAFDAAVFVNSLRLAGKDRVVGAFSK